MDFVYRFASMLMNVIHIGLIENSVTSICTISSIEPSYVNIILQSVLGLLNLWSTKSTNYYYASSWSKCNSQP